MERQFNDYQIHIIKQDDKVMITFLFPVKELKDISQGLGGMDTYTAPYIDLSYLTFNDAVVKMEYFQFIYAQVLKLYPTLYLHSFTYDGGSTITIFM